MVTQSAGPYTAVPMGMALAAHECRGRTAAEQMEYLRKAAHTISHARPTTVKRMALLCDLCLAEAERALAAGEDTAQAIVNKTVELNNTRYERVAKIGKYLVDLFPENGTVMTHCFAETIVGMMLRECSERGKHIRLFCPETRPYFQGARLTAFELAKAQVPVTLICDDMAATTMAQGRVDAVFVGADRIAANGDTANKVGTLGVAIAAARYGIPFYVVAPTSTIDVSAQHGEDIPIEKRAASEVLDPPIPGVKVYNPAFDVTPADLITAIITEEGVVAPADIISVVM